MKKTLLMLSALALCAALVCGCGKTPADDGNVGLPNPIKTYASAAEQAAAIGFGLEAPEGASDISYHSIDDMAETLFTLDGVKYCYRAQPTGELAAFDISGLYYSFGEPVNGSVTGREAAAFLSKEAGFVQWLDAAPGINYNLSVTSATTADELFRVAELVFSPVQGEA